MIKNGTRYTSKINPEVHDKSNNQQEENSFHQNLRLKFKEEASKLLYLEHTRVWYWYLDTSESR
jgi:hypothetical protein